MLTFKFHFQALLWALLLEATFGPVVASLVDGVTKVSGVYNRFN